MLELEVILQDVSPPVWRRLRLPASTPLGALHRALQALFGWEDRHLHQFTGWDGRTYVDRSLDPDAPEDALDEKATPLAELLPAVGDRLRYEYDFGDEWEIEIVRRALPADAVAKSAAVLLDGARAGPPEDCGGPFEYEDLLAALDDPDHAEHHELRAWAPRGFDPEGFDRERLEILLRAALMEPTRHRR